jgi:predicted nucleotidyltransferase
MTVKTAIQKMSRRIAKRFKPDKIVLFGSYARGSAGVDSDVDLLVIMPVNGSRRQMQVDIRCEVHDIPVPKDIIVVTPQEVSDQKEVIGTLIRPAMKEGKILYAKRKH